jgi:hypothetical protein
MGYLGPLNCGQATIYMLSTFEHVHRVLQLMDLQQLSELYMREKWW